MAKKLSLKQKARIADVVGKVVKKHPEFLKNKKAQSLVPDDMLIAGWSWGFKKTVSKESLRRAV